MHDATGPRGEVLLLERSAAVVAPLAVALRCRGLLVDEVTDLFAARAAFMARGGHDALVVAPDVPVAIAREVAAALREVDPRVEIVVFGEHGLGMVGERRVRGLHPAAPVACGAVVKALADP